ncbi:TlyA family RNA methyltransferase [Turicibacter sanguinis]|uniref:TlyA family RNA methyltransferase n=1 Tax=Turicibacter sanguinis TaxID=154288 RepID=UPI00399B374E
MKKERIDVLLTQLGYFNSRETAKRAIMAGLVLVDQQRIDKPGEMVPVESMNTVKGNVCPYVSRGGFKLEKAIKAFNLDLKDKIIIDIGSSTGGFTDCALQNGAKLSYAVDVGYNQLDWKIRQDERVICMERTNFRYMTPENLTHGVPEFACIDVSFISLKIIFPVLKQLLAKEGQVAALIKPQFEAGKDQVGKKGIVRDPKIHIKVIQEIVDFLTALELSVLGLTYSPIKGGEGNIEFLVHVGNNEQLTTLITEKEIINVVTEAHSQL